MKILPVVVAVSWLGACGGGHDAAEPSTVPIGPVATDVVYVVNGGDASLSVLDAVSLDVVGTLEISDAQYPHHLYLSSDRREMFLALPGVDLSDGHAGGHGGHQGGGHVMRLDASTGETLAVAALESANHNAAPSPVDATVWTTQMTEPGKVLVLDGTTLTTQSEIEVEDMPAEITFSSDGSVAFVANGGASSVTAIDPSTHEVLATIPVGAGPVGGWPGSDGLIYVDNETGRSISVIDPGALGVTRTLDLGFTPAFAAVVAEELWVTDVDAGRLVFYDRTTLDELGELQTGSNAHAIALSPGRAWVTNQGAASVSVIDIATHEVIETIAVGNDPNGIVYRSLP